MADWASITDAATALGVSQDTVKRRLRAGQIMGRRESTAKGFRWLIELPDGVAAPPGAPAPATSVASGAPADTPNGLAHMKELLGEVSRQRDDYAVQLTVKDQQIAELHNPSCSAPWSDSPCLSFLRLTRWQHTAKRRPRVNGDGAGGTRWCGGD